MSRLYIIGNGFDIAHGIPSKYSDFRDYCERNIPEMYMKLSRYYGNQIDDLWSRFEENMPSISQNAIFDWATINNPDWNQNMNGYYRFINEIRNEVDYVDTIKTDFTEWIQSIELANVHRLYHLLLEDSLFMAFNYTLTLENVYQVNPDQVLHIHGCVRGNFPQLILGHNMQDAEINDIFTSEVEIQQEACSEVASLVKGWRKDTQAVIAENEDFFSLLADITDVYVLGHSMADVDLPYFEHVRDIVNEGAIWHISYYGDNDRQGKELVAGRLDLRSFELIQLDDLRRAREGELF